MIIKTIEEVEEYIENLIFDTDIRRLQNSRYVYNKQQAEMHLSDMYSRKLNLNLHEGTFDSSVIELKRKVLLDSIKNHPNGVKINSVGGIMILD